MTYRNNRNVNCYFFGSGCRYELIPFLTDKGFSTVLVFIDHYFKSNFSLISDFLPKSNVSLVYVDSAEEPTTQLVDKLVVDYFNTHKASPDVIVSIGGGTTLDIGKAVSNLMTNPGSATDYQGWDLVKKPGIFKIGVPTLSGTGAESSRTCVLINHEKNIKLGMNSSFSVFDQLFLDPDLTKTVSRSQYFYTGMDTYIHCIESLNGRYRHALADSFSNEAIRLCQGVFSSTGDMMSDENREFLMVASYLGGASIANTYVGVVHPFSAALSVVFGTPHCLANCIAMNAMYEFYPKEYELFKVMIRNQGVNIPEGIAKDLTDAQYEKLFGATVVHEKPLSNALGPEFRKILTPEKCKSIFKLM